jgi:SAM-dependent methyltransferase
MIFHYLQTAHPVKDEEFDEIYPSAVKTLSGRHWTKIDIAKKAAQFLVTSPASKVLDIGSGAGKFCFIGMATTQGQFFGIEQRPNLVALSQDIIQQYNLDRVHISNANVVNTNFKDFDAFYLFNPFYENLDKNSSIDKSLPLSRPIYSKYRKYVFEQLSDMPAGTRVVTYFVNDSQIPPCYKAVRKDQGGLLKYYEKQG